MATINRTQNSPARKGIRQADKPYPEFPLTRHPTGRWCKKFRGKTHYFGPIGDPNGALKKYLAQVDRLKAGLPPLADLTVPTLRLLCNAFLTEKQRAVECGDLSRYSFDQYKADCAKVLEALGKEITLAELTPDHFGTLRAALHRGVGVGTARNRIVRARVLFKFAFDSGLAEHPLRYSVALKRPSQRSLRLARADRGLRMMEAAEIRALLAEASPMMKAAIMLGVNCGFGNSDVARLSERNLDLPGAWVALARRKTGIMRRAAMWPETIEAIRAAILVRPKPKDPADGGLAFLSRFGAPLLRETKGKTGSTVRVDAISQEFAKLLKSLSITRSGAFYLLRHTFQTIGEETGDYAAVRAVMGHADNAADMSAHYRARITDDRLRAVAEHVRGWLLAK